MWAQLHFFLRRITPQILLVDPNATRLRAQVQGLVAPDSVLL